MVSATTTGSGASDTPDVEGSVLVLGWEYDAGGRLLSETVPGGSRVFGYDVAGQLVSVSEPDGSRTEYVHDGLGRWTRLIGPDGSWTEYAWGPTGQLRSTADRTPDGANVSRHNLWVDALGELAAVDGSPLWWDTANPVPTLAGVGGGQVLSLPGGVTGIGEAWTAPGWRAAAPMVGGTVGVGLDLGEVCRSRPRFVGGCVHGHLSLAATVDGDGFHGGRWLMTVELDLPLIRA